MKPKKTTEADLEWKKPLFFQTGLLFALLFIWFFLDFFHHESDSDFTFEVKSLTIDGEQIMPTVQLIEIPPVKHEQPAPSFILNLVDETKDEFYIVIDAESEEDPDEIHALTLNNEEEVYELDLYMVVEEEPQYPGGEEARQKFLKDHLIYPKPAVDAKMEGTVIVGFVVETNGSLSNFKIFRSKAPSLDEEALRVAKLMPPWKAGKHQGKTIRVQYQMPIMFSLMD